MVEEYKRFQDRASIVSQFHGDTLATSRVGLNLGEGAGLVLGGERPDVGTANDRDHLEGRLLFREAEGMMKDVKVSEDMVEEYKRFQDRASIVSQFHGELGEHVPLGVVRDRLLVQQPLREVLAIIALKGVLSAIIANTSRSGC
jgi:hypothetical protein